MKRQLLYHDALIEITHDEIVLKHWRLVLGRKHLRWNLIHSIWVRTPDEEAPGSPLLPQSSLPLSLLSPLPALPSPALPSFAARSSLTHVATPFAHDAKRATRDRWFIVNLLHSPQKMGFTVENSALVECILRCNTCLC
jgi:hypothetical protein